jgi:hypothetical protein
LKITLVLFEEKKVRSLWDEEEEQWYFSIVDVVEILTESPNARNYWKVLKHRLLKEGNETVTNCNQLKFAAEDGKMRLTDVANVEQLFRLILLSFAVPQNEINCVLRNCSIKIILKQFVLL